MQTLCVDIEESAILGRAVHEQAVEVFVQREPQAVALVRAEAERLRLRDPLAWEDGAALLSRLEQDRQVRPTCADAREHPVAVQLGETDIEENEIDVMCFGAAIRDDRGAPVCAISVAGPRQRIAEKAQSSMRLSATMTGRLARLASFMRLLPSGRGAGAAEGRTRPPLAPRAC
mgnify:CR=1 FL=1